MSRTLEDIEKDLNIVRNELKLSEEQIDLARKIHMKAKRKERQIIQELHAYKLNNRCFNAMEDLCKYINKDISYIVLVKEDENNNLYTMTLNNDEYDVVFKVNKNGHLYYSDDYNTIEFNKRINAYVEGDCFYKARCNFVGFLDIKLKEN